MSTDQAPAVLRISNRLHHVGITVNDLQRSLRFWAELTGGTPREIGTVDAPHLSPLLGYEGVVLEVGNVIVSETLTIELLQYSSHPDEPYDPETTHPGNVHVCFDVEDMDASWQHAVDCGAVPVSDGPIRVPSGGSLAYLRSVDGASVELRSMPPP